MNKLVIGKCEELMPELPKGCAELVIADLPFNIGMKYDVYNDKKDRFWYLNWVSRVVKESKRVLAGNGSIYICIGDEYVANVWMILREAGFVMRNWIVWYYTFGQSTSDKFARCHTHILYFVKNGGDFIFNRDLIRVRSARQDVYKDLRADPRGKIPDDVWTFPRVCGTHSERVEGHSCQMPLELLHRIILTSSNTGGLVIDPCMGTGTTLVSAALNGRSWWGCDISAEYVAIAERRISQCTVAK